jgi:hypothetical protein
MCVVVFGGDVTDAVPTQSGSHSDDSVDPFEIPLELPLSSNNNFILLFSVE